MKKNLILAIIALLSVVQLNAQSVWGYVNYFNNPLYPIDGITVKLYTMSDQLVATTTTDGNGYYVFNNVSGTQYKIRASTNMPGFQANIVNANDILLFLNGQLEFNTWQYIAADVDANGVVNIADYQFVAVNHYLFGQAFPAGAWQFSEAQIDLIVNGGGGPSNLGGSRLGDTDGVFIPTGRETGEIFIQAHSALSDIQLDSELIIPLELLSASGVSAYGLALSFNPEMMSIVGVDAGFGFGGYSLSHGLLRISSLGAPAGDSHTLNIKAKLHSLSEMPQLPFRVLGESHVIDGLGNKSAAFTVRMPRLGNQIASSGLQVFPNPAQNIASLKLVDVPSGLYQVQIISSNGQVVANNQVAVHGALQQLSFPLHSLSGGIYTVRALNSETGMVLNTRFVKM